MRAKSPWPYLWHCSSGQGQILDSRQIILLLGLHKERYALKQSDLQVQVWSWGHLFFKGSRGTRKPPAWSEGQSQCSKRRAPATGRAKPLHPPSPPEATAPPYLSMGQLAASHLPPCLLVQPNTSKCYFDCQKHSPSSKGVYSFLRTQSRMLIFLELETNEIVECMSLVLSQTSIQALALHLVLAYTKAVFGPPLASSFHIQCGTVTLTPWATYHHYAYGKTFTATSLISDKVRETGFHLFICIYLYWKNSDVNSKNQLSRWFSFFFLFALFSIFHGNNKTSHIICIKEIKGHTCLKSFC